MIWLKKSCCMKGKQTMAQQLRIQMREFRKQQIFTAMSPMTIKSTLYRN
jgi:hypothetical protein